jgi:hypothetical protein
MFSGNRSSFRRTHRQGGVRAALVAGLVAVLSAVLVPVGFAITNDQMPGPIHAGNTYGWYYQHNLWRQEFESGLPGIWHKKGRGTVREQHGMISLEANRGSATATLTGHAHRYGRWEVRLRSNRYEKGAANYKVVTELIPARAARHCGARNIALESYRIGTTRVHLYDRTLPNHEYRAKQRVRIRSNYFHTYAVEVTRTHISWFIDAHVVRTERRPAALSGTLMTFRFALVAQPGKKMNHSRMQADWMRYWTYNRPSTKSIKAPQTTSGIYEKAC